jgi:hypothetical protein
MWENKIRNVLTFSDLPPPRKRPQNFSPSMEDLSHPDSVPYSKLGKAHSLKLHHSEHELGDDQDETSESLLSLLL